MKKKISLIVLGIFLCGVFVFFQSRPPKKTYLKIITYPSFLSPYGPGVEIKEKFEAFCDCEVRWMKVEDSTLIVQRLQLRSDGMGVDVVVGLDQITAFSANKQWKWKNLSISPENFIPIARGWIQKWTVPISWSPLSFISKKNNNLPTNLMSLVQDNRWKKKISIPDPRYSTLGLQFYFWVVSVLKEEEKVLEFLKQLKNQAYSISHSWSSSYGLFQKGFVDITFTYQSSWVYHFNEENKKYFFSSFKEGHPYQVEYVAVPETCRQCGLAQKFIEFLLRKDIQKILMEKNYMLPVIQGVRKNSPFEQLENWPTISYEQMENFLSEKKKWIQIWEQVFL